MAENMNEEEHALLVEAFQILKSLTECKFGISEGQPLTEEHQSAYNFVYDNNYLGE
jgi:hypothetical protein